MNISYRTHKMYDMSLEDGGYVRIFALLDFEVYITEWRDTKNATVHRKIVHQNLQYKTLYDAALAAGPNKEYKSENPRNDSSHRMSDGVPRKYERFE